MPSDIRVRPAHPEDAGRLAEFNMRLAEETEGKKLDFAVVTSGTAAVFEDSRRGFYLVAEIDHQVVGSLLVTTEWSDWRNGTFWWIQSVYVLPEFRRRGVFQALYEKVKSMAKNEPRVCGCRLYVEKDNHAAQETYRRLGMTETSYKVFEELF